MSAPSCHRHPETPATAACGGCLKPMCAACSVFEGGRDLCPACVTRYHRAKRVRLGVGIAAFVAGVAVLGTYFAGVLRHATVAASTPGSESDTPRIRFLRAQLEREPCNRNQAAELVQSLLQARDWRGTIEAGDAFVARCGKSKQMRAWTYTARMALSEHALAVRDATELVDGSPSNATYRVWRAQAHEAAGTKDAALADYEEAFRLEPAASQVLNLLVTAYQEQKRPCDALLALQQHLRTRPRAMNGDLLLQMYKLSESGACNVDGRGRAVLAMGRSGPIWAEARVGGKEYGVFVVDTGATHVALSEAFAKRLGLKLQGARRVAFATANGMSVARLTRVKRIELQGARADDIEVLVTPGLPNGLDGLLGMTFLSRFEVKADAKAGRMEISERTRRSPAPAGTARADP